MRLFEHKFSTHRLRGRSEELIIDLVHRSKVIHCGDEDVDLDRIIQAAPCLFKHGLEVLEGLSLCCTSTSKGSGHGHGSKLVITYSPVLDRSSDDLGSFWVHPNIARAVNQAIILDGLGELRKRLRSTLREHGFDLTHLSGS